jgi:hypothetical protein
MQTIHNASIDNNLLTLELNHFEKGELPGYCYPAENCLGALIITQDHRVRVVQVVNDNTVVLAIETGEEFEYDPKLLMKWNDLLRQNFSKATEQLEFVTDVKPYRHLGLVS